MNEPSAWERMLSKAERERDEAVAEVERLRAKIADPQALLAALVEMGVLHERREDYLLPDGSMDGRYLSQRRLFTDWQEVVPR